MKKIILLIGIICVCSCSEQNESEPIANNPDGFVDAFNAFHHEYYKNNKISMVAIADDISNTEYHYNANGDLFELRFYHIDGNGDEVFNEFNSATYELVYDNSRLTRINYDAQKLLTHSLISYTNGLKTKISDYRDETLFSFTEFEYNSDGVLILSRYTNLNGAGVRFGNSPTTVERIISYNEKGNIEAINQRNAANELEQTGLYRYAGDSALPIQFNDKNLSYTSAE